MSPFSLTDFARYALDFVQSHPWAQIVLMTTGLLLALKCALVVEAEQRRKEEDHERLMRRIAQAQDETRAQVFRVMKGGR